MTSNFAGGLREGALMGDGFIFRALVRFFLAGAGRPAAWGMA